MGGSWRHTCILVPLHGRRLWIRPLTVVAKKELDATTKDAKKGKRAGRLRRNPYKQSITPSRCTEREKYRLSRKE